MHYDAIIVGGGVIGASIAYYLTKTSNFKVILCEKGNPPGKGSSSISGGLIRVHHTNTANQSLSFRSLQIYRELTKYKKLEFDYNPIGFSLIVGPKHLNNFRLNVQSMRDLGFPVTIYAPGEYKTKEPFISYDGVGLISHEPLGGYGDPAKTSLSFITEALNQGLHLMEGTEVKKLIVSNNKVIGVQTNLSRMYSKRVILANNSWISLLTRPLGIDIPIRIKRLGFIFADPAVKPIISHSYIDDILDLYLRPMHDGRILIGIKSTEWHENTDNPVKLISEQEAHEALSKASKRFPILKKSKVLGGRTSFEGYTPDEHPIIGPTQIEGLYLAAGFSGGGYKIAPAIGEAVAEEIKYGRVIDTLKHYRIDRFKSNSTTFFQKSNLYQSM